MTQSTKGAVSLREATQEDATVCGEICFEAFAAISALHGFPNDFPTSEVAGGLLSNLFGSSKVSGTVAERDGVVIGSNLLHEYDVVYGIGPLSVRPSLQNDGVGRLLMQRAMRRAQERGAAGVRLVQAMYHNRSLALYASMGFEAREPLACMQGKLRTAGTLGDLVRMAKHTDLTACNALAERVHGFVRANELEAAVDRGTARIVERKGRLTGYTTQLGFFGHCTTETDHDMQALIASGEALAGPGILVPMRRTGLLRWCLAEGLRIVQPMMLMTTGVYTEPAGAWLPSVIF